MTRLTAAILAGMVVGLISVELAALIIALLSLCMSMFAVSIARQARMSRREELERQTIAVQEVAKVRDEVEAKLQDGPDVFDA